MFRSLAIDTSSLIALGNERLQVLPPKTNLTKIINDYNCNFPYSYFHFYMLFENFITTKTNGAAVDVITQCLI